MLEDEAPLQHPGDPTNTSELRFQQPDTPIASVTSAHAAPSTSSVCSSSPEDTPAPDAENDDTGATNKLPQIKNREKLGSVQVRVVPIDNYADMIRIPSLPRERKRRPVLLALRNTFILLLVLLGSSTLLYPSFATSMRSGQWHTVFEAITQAKTTAINGANRWDADTQTTAPTFDFPRSSSQTLSVSPLFATYYNSHYGTQSLGVPVTVAFPTYQGWMQFFEWGALLLPTVSKEHSRDTEDPLIELTAAGVRDPGSGIVRLPLIQALLTVGGQEPIGDDESPLTFVDLRKATNPNLMVSVSAEGHTVAPSSLASQGVFIKGGTRAGKDVGHVIPQLFWHYIHRADVSPDGWETDFGAPLTEALSFSVAKNGSVHRMLVQVFWRDGVIFDQNDPDASGQPQIQRIETGSAYLRTLGPPPIVNPIGQTVWGQGDSAVLDAPQTGQAIAHIGQNFPLTLLGDTSWKTGMLWYHVQWIVPKRTGTGWLPATTLTFTSPGPVAGSASWDVLSPSLAAYLASMGDNVGAVVYDVTRKQYYTNNATSQFMMASSMKIPIMLTLLDMTEHQGREPNDQEMNLLTAMIENSDNDSASALYFGEIGGAAGVTSFLQRIGITDLAPDSDSWGYSLITPLAMVNLLTQLYEGKILTVQDRNLALSLMEQVESDQQVGVGDTAPNGATVALKDGWVPAPDGSWVMNSSGIVMLGQETYIIAVYTQEQSSLEGGQAITEHVCQTVASLLT